MQTHLKPLKKKHQDDTCMVIGGGEAAEYIDRLKDECKLIIGCNHHWVKYGVQADYMVYIDPSEWPWLKDALSRLKGKTVSLLKEEDADIKLYYGTMRKWVAVRRSGLIAIWFALQITSGRIYLCGFDCYKGQPLYKKEFPRFRKFFDHPEWNRVVWLR